MLMIETLVLLAAFTIDIWLENGISAPGTTVHIFYAVKTGPQYLERYERHFKDPDIRRNKLQHEQLLVCYPEAWVQQIVKCCEVTKEKIL